MKTRVKTAEEWRMCMTPKPGKDQAKVKWWRPIVLANTVGKWCEKIVAQGLGEQEKLWHAQSFAGRNGRGAIDSKMMLDSIRKETGGDVYGTDIKSAFNAVQ